jgi:cell division protein FtsB
MRPSQGLRRWARQIWLPVLGACVFGYFAYHVVQGDRGVIAWIRLEDELKESRTTLAQLKSERESLERRVELLNTGSLDLDLLEERARLMLNFVHPDDRLLVLRQP